MGDPTIISVDGLESEVQILVDRWGVPHIYADGRGDLYLAQGFNAARDRLFQIDLWRRRGLGRLSEVFGASYVQQDRAARLFLYRGDTRAEWLAYGASTKAIVTSFTAGINAYVTWALADPERLPPEFSALGYAPAHWSPADVSRIRSHGLFYNAEQELARGITLRDFGTVAEELRQAREPADPLVVPAGLNLSVLTEDMLDVYRLGLAPFSAAGIVPRESGASESSGSNNWVLAADRSATGRPLLANDPHRSVTVPSLRYVAHLCAPGIDVIGGGEPALPGISIGHNGRVAFGLTIWPADQEDLYVYETDPERPDRYRYGGGWEPMNRVTETVAVAGGSTEEIELLFTRHGPVIYADASRNVAVGLRAVWLQPGMAPYLASLAYQQAPDAAAFIEALNHWGAPAVNHVYADVNGTVGLKNAAMIPVRPNWDGSLPVPGDGRYEWNGFYTADELPHREADSGWFASANEENLPEGHSNVERTVTYDWYPPGRFERVAETLSSDELVDVARSVELQNDVVSYAAREIVAELRRVDPDRVRLADEFRALQTWAADEGTDSREAAVFQVWVRRHLRPLLFAFSLRRDGLDDDTIARSMRVLLRDESFSPDLRGELAVLRSLTTPGDLETLAEMVDTSLPPALQELESRLGPDRSAWTWGGLHHAVMKHAVFSTAAGVPNGWRQVGPAPKRGSGESVAAAAYGRDFAMTMGSTFRIVVDVGEFDRSMVMNSPGQSGDPRSPHYADLFQPWIEAEAFPLAYSRAAVEECTVERFLLRPASSAE
jgi:penicillin amidase